jgi:uncharacterized protein (TIGR03067 family)
MVRYLLCFAVCVALAVTNSAGQDKKDKDKEGGKLEGTWTATSWQRGDREIGRDEVDTVLVLAKGTYEFPEGINRISQKGTIKVDAAKGTIDFTPEDGPAKGKTLLGIYKVDGDKLTLCFTSPGGERPKEFKSGERSTVLATYERKKK